MIIVLYNTLLNIFAWKRRLTNFLLLSLIIIIIIIIIIITCKRSRQSTTVIGIRGIISSSTAGQLSRLTKHNCQTRGVFYEFSVTKEEDEGFFAKTHQRGKGFI